jgi:hypothetical protein
MATITFRRVVQMLTPSNPFPTLPRDAMWEPFAALCWMLNRLAHYGRLATVDRENGCDADTENFLLWRIVSFHEGGSLDGKNCVHNSARSMDDIHRIPTCSRTTLFSHAIHVPNRGLHRR